MVLEKAQMPNTAFQREVGVALLALQRKLDSIPGEIGRRLAFQAAPERYTEP